MAATGDTDKECLVNAFICMYSSCTFKDPLIGCRGKSESCCFRSEGWCVLRAYHHHHCYLATAP
jgi:hypothetical protein